MSGGLEALFAPPGGWVVKIIDLSAPADDNVVEHVRGFPTLMQANEFARRYVRDSLERCRAPRLTAAEILSAWMAFGEDAVPEDAGETGFKSAAEIGNWAQHKASGEERNWRALDPRQDRHDRDPDDAGTNDLGDLGGDEETEE